MVRENRRKSRGLTLDLGCGHRKYGDVNLDIREEVEPTVIADAHHVPFKNESFSDVYNFEVVEHVSSPLKMLLEANRILKDGGRLIISTPNPYFWRKIAKIVLFGEAYSAREHITAYTIAVLKNLLREAGFIADFAKYLELPWADDYYKKYRSRDSMIPIRAFGMRQILVSAHVDPIKIVV